MGLCQLSLARPSCPGLKAGKKGLRRALLRGNLYPLEPRRADMGLPRGEGAPRGPCRGGQLTPSASPPPPPGRGAVQSILLGTAAAVLTPARSGTLEAGAGRDPW